MTPADLLPLITEGGGYAQSYGYGSTGYGQNETLSTLQQFYQLVRDYRVEVTITGMFLGNWILTFIGAQGIKRKLRPFLKQQLADWQVWAIVYGLSFLLNGLAWWAFVPDLPAPVAIVVMVASALMLERSVNRIMDWAQAGAAGSKRRDFYHWMRNDRRGPNRNGSKPPDYFTDEQVYGAQGADDPTEPKS